MTWKRNMAPTAVAIAAMLVVWHAASAESEPAPITAAKILYFKISGTEKRFGKLEFVGGLQLSSDADDFGGLSSLRLYPDRNHLIALTDRCLVLKGKLERDITGALHDVKDASLTALPPGPDGRPLAKSGYNDCEALEIFDTKAFVAFERNNTIGRFEMLVDGSLGNFGVVIGKDKVGRLGKNRGIEAFAIFPEGTPLARHGIAIAEETLNSDGNHRAFIEGPTTSGELAIARSGEYAITDADFLPNGDLLILERRFGLRISPGIRIRRIPATELLPGKTADGEVLLEADLSYRIDNMEGLDVSLDEAGQIFVTLISDDNFNYFQSTILLEFKLVQ